MVNSASVSGWVVSHDFLLDCDLFTGKGEPEVVVEFAVFVIGSAAELPINGLTREISGRTFQLCDTIDIAVDERESSSFHNASALSEEESVVPFDVRSFCDDLLYFAEDVKLFLRDGVWVLSNSFAAAVFHDNLVVVPVLSAVLNCVLDSTSKVSIALGVSDIVNLKGLALWLVKDREAKGAKITNDVEGKTSYFLILSGTGSQKGLGFATFATLHAADIRGDDLSAENIIEWFVSWYWRSISLLVSHWLDVSLDTLSHVVKFELFFFVAIWHETGLNEISTSHLDTSFTAARLWLSESHHDIRVNDGVDKRSDCSKRIKEEVGCFLEGKITSFAWGSIKSIDAHTINVVVFTWLTTLAGFSSNVLTALVSGAEFSTDLFWLAKDNSDDTRN